MGNKPRTILRKSYINRQPWRKKDGIFDVGMGAYHGAQVFELVGLFMMSRLKHINDLGLVIYDIVHIQREI